MGQYVSSSPSQALFINIRYGVLYLGFFSDDTPANTTVTVNTWYHAAFVYDQTSRQQAIYMNGLLVGQSANSDSLETTSGIFTIGGASIGGSTHQDVYYSGYIDHLTISDRAKMPCEIYLDAILACYFTFDLAMFSIDSGPNFLHAVIANATSVFGRVNQALQLCSPLSYVAINEITALHVPSPTFTIAMWINPVSVTGGATLIHTSMLANGL